MNFKFRSRGLLDFMKKLILLTLVAAQTVSLSCAYGDDDDSAGGFLQDADGSINLGGLLKVDKDGNVEMGVGENRITVDDDVSISTDGNSIGVSDGDVNINAGGSSVNVNGGDVDLSTSGTNINVNGGDVNLEAGGSRIDVSGGDVDISAADTTINTNGGASLEGRQVVSDGVFFDSKGKPIKLNSGDFSRLEFSNIELRNQDLQNADFSWSTISNVSFAGSNLAGADFSRTTLINVDFSRADLTGADLSWAKFNVVNFTSAMIIGADLKRTDLTDVDFDLALVRGSCFEFNEFVNVQLTNVDLTDSMFERYDFDNVDFSGTDKGAAVWDANDCAAISGYTERGGVSSANTQVETLVTEREELIQASSIVEKLAEGAGTQIDLTVNFRTDSDQLHGGAHAQVAEIAKALNADALKGAPVLIIGHTDSDGASDYNVDLSYRRASTVQRVLVKDYDVQLDALSIKGFGEDRPVASNDTATGRGLNRRVTLVRK